MELYKVVGPNGEPLNGGSGLWPLPSDTEPGEWRSVDGPVIACRNGLHLTDAEHLRTWIPFGQPFVVYRAETRGALVNAGEKYAAQSARLLPRRLTAPDWQAIERRTEAAARRAERRLERAVPEPWRTYLGSIGSHNLPAGHPGRHYGAIMKEAQVAYRAECERISRTRTRAVVRAMRAA